MTALGAARRACIVGVGNTEFSRDSGRSVNRLAFDAIKAAASDAGIDPRMIDGIVPFMHGPSAEDVMVMFGLGDVRFTSVPHLGGAGSVAAVRIAALAIETGQADYVVAFVARNGRSGARVDKRVQTLPGQAIRQELELVNGMNTPAQWYSLICRRHMHEFGTTREALGTVALTMRDNAQGNENAQMRGRLLTMEDYLSAPVVADPYLLYDCCLETDGACAVILTSSERARDCPALPAMIEGAAEGHPESPDDIGNRADIFETGLGSAAPRAFAAAGLTPGDVDVALIYDCFTFEVIQQLEEAGFCGRGEGGPFVLDGNIAAFGSLPVNPHGGLLSEGHIGGMNHVVEAVRQLRGACGPRQVVDAEVAVVTGWGDMGDGTIAVLTRG
jgi:acetyl-CoA acetyltransferase